MVRRSAPGASVDSVAPFAPDAPEPVERMLSRIPAVVGFQRVEDLPGGLTNRNYRVTTESGATVVARFSSPQSGLLTIDRESECSNARRAAEAGVAPEIVEYVPDERVMIVQWIDGRTFGDEDLDDPEQLTRVAAVCAQLHGGPRFVTDFDMFEVQRRYLDIVVEQGFRLPDDYLSYESELARIEHALRGSAVGTVPCHNDLLAANIMDDGSRLWLIDFEYSGNNDACFELGNIWSEAALEPDRLEHLVAAYFGGPSPVQVARARLFGTVAKYGWTLWASVQDALSDVDFDFWQWGMAKYTRACEELHSPDLHHLISTVEESARP